MAKKKLIDVAIHFLFPSLSRASKEYEEIEKFIEKEYLRLQTSVLYYRNEKFMKLLNSLGLSIGEKEVIITSNAVRATNKYSITPSIIFEY